MATLLCLAAGMSSRYGRPKQLDAIGPADATILDFTIADALRAGVERVVVVVHPEARQAFALGIGARWARRIAVELVPQPPRRPGGAPWGTADAVLAAAPLLVEPFMIANADDFYGRSSIAALAAVVEAFPPDALRGAAAGFRVGDTLSPAGGVHRALLDVRNGTLVRIEELRDLSATADGTVLVPGAEPRRLSSDALVSMNLWGFTPAILPELASALERFRAHAAPHEELRIADVVAQLLARSAMRVDVIGVRGPWTGLTHPGDRERTSALLHALTGRGDYPFPVWG